MEMWSIWQAQQMPIAAMQITLLKTNKKKMKSHFIFGILAENTQEAELETGDVFVILLIA